MSKGPKNLGSDSKIGEILWVEKKFSPPAHSNYGPRILVIFFAIGLNIELS